jgi:hypothetical protein
MEIEREILISMICDWLMPTFELSLGGVASAIGLVRLGDVAPIRPHDSLCISN